MLRSKRDHDRIVGRGGLELEIKGSTKTFSQREAPSAIDSIAERRMQNELHPTRFIEEALHHQRLLCWNRTESPINIGEIVGDLLGGLGRQIDFRNKPRANILAVAQQFLDLTAKI